MADEITTKRRGRPPKPKTEPVTTQTTPATTEFIRGVTPITDANRPVRKRNRPDLDKYGQEYVEPGDNSRYLRHALATLDMPPIDISDPQQVSDRIDWYFNHCIENEMKPTVCGFCNSLGITRKTLMDWRNGTFREDTHQAIIVRAYKILEELWENYMQNGKINPVTGIFLGKNNFGYQDKQEYVVTPNTAGIEATNPDIIEAKYAELPEE